MSKKIKYSVDDWSDTFTDKRKAKYGGLTKEEFNFGNKQLIRELVEACGRKKLIPLKAQQGINEGTLGMTGAKYKKLYGVPEPLNDNLTVAQVRVKNMSMIIATKDISDHADDKISPEEGVKIGRLAALQSRVVLSGRLKDRILKEVALLEKEDKANEKRLTREFKAGKRPILPE